MLISSIQFYLSNSPPPLLLPFAPFEKRKFLFIRYYDILPTSGCRKTEKVPAAVSLPMPFFALGVESRLRVLEESCIIRKKSMNRRKPKFSGGKIYENH